MDRKSTLIKLIDKAYETEQEFIKNLSEAQRLQPGSSDNWSAKDLIAHNAAWKQRHTENVMAIQQGREAKRVEDYDHENKNLYLEHKNKTWEEVLSYAESAQRKLTNLVSNLPTETLEKFGYFHWQEDRPLWRTIYGYGYSHPLVHLAEHYRNRGERLKAADLIKQLADAMQSLDASLVWQGGINYNLACYHALAGQLEEAIEELSKALQLNPEFKDWVNQDQDLEALRDHPKYLAMVKDVT